MASTAIMLLAVATFLGVLVATAFADGQGEAGNPYEQCQSEIQENPLNACRQLMMQQLSRRFRGSPGTRLQCCQQLRDVSRGCRCDAIRKMVSDYEEEASWQEGSQEGQEGEEEEEGYYGGASTGAGTTRVRLTRVRLFSARLPSQCGISPQYCSIFSSSD